MTVKFERAEELTLNELLQMANDGYEFIVENGRMDTVIVPVIGTEY